MESLADLREEAANAFKQGKYHVAIERFKKCIILRPDLPIFYTNRALCYLRLFTELNEPLHEEEIVSDCDKAIELDRDCMKAHYFRGQCLLYAEKFGEADRSLMRAYALAIEQRSPSVDAILEMIFKGKQRRFEKKERARMLEEDELLMYVMQKLRAEHKRHLRDPNLGESEREKLEQEQKWVEDGLFRVFAKSRPTVAKEPPPSLTDPITLNIFRDPVVAPSGNTYERGSLLHHLVKDPIDPITRSPLSSKDLIPNRAIKELADKFLEENGDAVYY